MTENTHRLRAERTKCNWIQKRDVVDQITTSSKLIFFLHLVIHTFSCDEYKVLVITNYQYMIHHFILSTHLSASLDITSGLNQTKSKGLLRLEVYDFNIMFLQATILNFNQLHALLQYLLLKDLVLSHGLMAIWFHCKCLGDNLIAQYYTLVLKFLFPNQFNSENINGKRVNYVMLQSNTCTFQTKALPYQTLVILVTVTIFSGCFSDNA